MSVASTNDYHKEEISMKRRRHLHLKNNENATYENLWEVAKAVLTVKFIALSDNIRKRRLTMKELTIHSRK